MTVTVCAPYDEASLPGDRYRDFCLWEYPPATDPEGGLRAVGLLWHALRVMQAPPSFEQALRALQDALGQGSIVWGIKQAAEKISVELYFYDYARLRRTVTAERIVDILAPWFGCDLRIPQGVPYFMVSLDLDAALAASGKIGALNLYLGNPGSTVSSGINFELGPSGIEMRNTYHFFDARAEGSAIRRKITESARIDLMHYRSEMLLWRELAGCQTVVVANKRSADGLYYTRLTVDQLIWFLNRVNFAPELVEAVAARRPRLQHLLFDAGFDYRMREGQMEILKSAWYGLL